MRSPGRLSLERDVFPRLATDGELTAVVGEGADRHRDGAAVHRGP